MSVYFEGSYFNPTTPIWLSATNPTPGPNNLQVSTLTVNSAGGIALTSDNVAYPGSGGAAVAFNRITGQPPTELAQTPSKTVPTKAVEGTYLASVTNGGTVYDDIALSGLQIYGNQVTTPAANTGCAGYLTQGPEPFSVELITGKFYTPIVNATIGNFSTINVSTGTLTIPDPLNVSTLNASTINTGNLNTSSIVAGSGSFSTINISTFVLPTNFGFDTITGSTINVSTISSGTITSGIGTFSTLNAPGFSGGGGGVTTSTVTASSITTGLLSTLVAVTKEIFVSTMTFNATLSPNLDLGLGGIIGGLAGGFGANALSVGLGAGGLATGIAALAMSRQSGGINPSVFQTVNGTSQLQFSTLGNTTITTFTTTDSANPDTTPGNPVNTNRAITAGSYCVRTVSDPLNLPNASGTSGLGIQGFSQWEPVYSGKTQLVNNAVSSLISGNSIDFGSTTVIPGVPNSPMIFNTGANTGANVGYFQFNGAILGTTLGLGPTFGSGGNGDINAEQAELAQSVRVPETYTSTIYAYNYTNQTFLSTLNIVPGLRTSTINVSSFVIGNAQFQNLTVSTINTSTLNVSGVISYNTQTGDSINTRIFNAIQSIGTTALTAQSIGTTTLTTQNLSTQTASISSIVGLSTINGVVYPPPAVAPTPVGAVIAFAGANAPAGWLICDGVNYSQVTYAALYAVIGINYGAVGAGNFAVPDLRSRTVFGSSAPTFLSQFAPFSMIATTFSSVITEFPGSVAPNGIVARQALAVQNIQPGYELAVGMRVNATTGADQTQRVIIDILNYPGNFGQGGPFSYPNFPIIILNTPFTIDLAYLGPVFTVTPISPYKYTLGLQTSGNFNTQTPYQVAGHTHTQLQGGNSSPLLVNASKSGDLNTSGPQTGGVTQNYYYTIGPAIVGQQPVVYNIPTSMATVPSAVAMNWIIKT